MVDVHYRAFISYSHLDREWGEWLHRKLETYRVPKKLVGKLTQEGSVPRRLTPIFRDREDLPTSGDLSASVEAALEASRFLIVICTPEAARSEWVNEEIRRFKMQHGDRRILAAIVDSAGAGEGDAAADPETCFPQSLRYKLDNDGNITDERAEPLAADLRESGDGKKYGALKIVAGLIGVGLDDLIQRESHRRNTQMQFFAGATTAVAVAMGAMTFVAMDARNDATLQRDQAEGLVEFMLTDLKEKLDAVGRLDALDSVGERALEYYAAQNTGKLDADSLGRRARAQLLVGEIDNLRGDLDAALTAYMEAAATTEEQLSRDPNNEQRLFDHAQSVFWVGYIAWQRGDTAKAEEQFQQYLALAEKLVEIDPENSDWQTELGYAYSNLGTLFLEGRRWDDALEHFEQSRVILTDLLDGDPSNTRLKLNAAQSDSWIARTLENQGDFSQAENGYRRELATYKEILTDQPNNQTALRRSLVTQRSLAGVHLALGTTSAALNQLMDAQTLIDVAMSLESDNTLWIERASQIHTDLANVYSFLGDEPTALREAERAVNFAENLLRRDRNVVLWRILYGTAQLSKIKALAENNADQSVSLLTELINDLAPLALEDGQEKKIRIHLAKTNLALGIALEQTKHTLDAHAAYGNALKPYNGNYHDLSPESATTVAALLVKLGRTSDAKIIITKLDALNFRHPEFAALKKNITKSQDD